MVAGLSPGTGYQFRVRSTDMNGLAVEADVLSAGSSSSSGKVAATVVTLSSGDAIAPAIIQMPTVVPITNQSVRIDWTTNEVSNSTVQYGTSTSVLTQVAGDIEYVTSHQVTLTKLSTTVTYYARVISTDPSGNSATSPTFSFVVAPQTTQPVLTIAVTGGGRGSIASNPVGINCGSDCSEAYVGGTSVTLTATPFSGSSFGGWSGGGCTGTGTCNVTLIASVTVTATFNSTGVSRLSNLATRGPMLTGDNVMIAGITIGGSSAKRVLITARGPSLAALGVPGTVANPMLTLYSGQAIIASNDDWAAARMHPRSRLPASARAMHWNQQSL